jgi:hypothetical protein
VIDKLFQIQARLTERDYTLLGWLADHSVLTSAQIAQALFPIRDVAQERLRALTLAGVISRFRPHRPEGGSHPYHYVLDQLGLDVITAQHGDEPTRRDKARQRRWHLTSRANLPHLLGGNQFFIDLLAHARTPPEAELRRWWSAARCQQLGAFAEPEEDGNPTIQAFRASIRPDGYGLWVEHGRGVPFCFEYDTGSEPLTTLIDKIDRYRGLFDRLPRCWPILMSLPTPGRERNLHQRLAQHPPQLTVATTVRDAGLDGWDCPANAVWWVWGQPGPRERLADLGRFACGVNLPRVD